MASVMDRSSDKREASARGSSQTVWVEGNSQGKMPWGKRKLFLAWLLPFAALLIGAVAWGVDHVEDDLEDAAIAELNDQFGIEATRDDVDFDYRDGTVDVTPSGWYLGRCCCRRTRIGD